MKVKIGKFIFIAILIALAGGMGFTYKAITMEEKTKKHGMVSWGHLITTDVKASKVFYEKLFGWTIEDISTEGVPYSTIVKTGDKEIAGIVQMPAEAKGEQPSWDPYITVDDVDSTAKLAENLGAMLLVTPHDIPSVGRFCVIIDPQGAVIAAITYKE